MVIHLLEQYSMQQMQANEQQPAVDASWIPLSLHDGGVPFELLFQTYDELFSSKTPPWHTQAGASFLLPSIVTVLEQWSQELSATGYGTMYASSSPVIELEAGVGRYLAEVGGGGGGSAAAKGAGLRAKLADIDRAIKARFY